jgi:glycosyltransferase involved in cell wall biosynthesis
MLSKLYVNADKPFHPTLPDPGVVRALRRLLKEVRPDVVHAHSWMLYSLLPLLPTPETRLVVTIHEYALVCPKGTFVYRDGSLCTGPGYRKCVACAAHHYGTLRSVALTTGLTAMKPWVERVDRYVANSEPTARMTAPFLAHGKLAMDVIPPFVVKEAFHAQDGKRPAFVPAEGDYFMFAGSLGPHKGIDVLLNAWGGLEPRIPLVLAGLRRPETPEKFPTGVIVAENVEHGDVLRGFGHCIAALVPSRWPEPFGTVAAEAMAAGRPVIASAVGGLADVVVDGVTGILVRPGDVSELRRAMQRLLGDAGLRARMGAEGQKRAATYSIDVIVPRWEELFRDVIARRRRNSVAARSVEMPG